MKVVLKVLLTRQQRARSCWDSSSAMSCVSSRVLSTFSLGVLWSMNVNVVMEKEK